MDFAALNEKIAPQNAAAMREARARWNAIAKPLHSLGRLEEATVKLAGLTGSADLLLKRRGVIVMCADNGVVCRGVSQCGAEVTAAVAAQMAAGRSSVCCMARTADADVLPVDIGMLSQVPGTLDRCVTRGTRDLTVGPAMTREEALEAISVGLQLAREYRAEGYDIIATGEMGIGNTTTSSAISAVLLDLPVERLTGRGSGLSDGGLLRKVEAIKRGIECNKPRREDALEVLCKLGGLDIAGMAGLFIGGALYRIPVLVDGVISATAALIALRLCPACGCAMLASHVSAEPAAALLLEELGLSPLISADMRLGEGTGAVCALPLLDMALSVYNGMPTFSEIGITAYTPQGGR